MSQQLLDAQTRTARGRQAARLRFDQDVLVRINQINKLIDEAADKGHDNLAFDSAQRSKGENYSYVERSVMESLREHYKAKNFEARIDNTFETKLIISWNLKLS